MKKKLEDFTILKYAIDQLMVASLTNDNVYTLSDNNDKTDLMYMIPIKGFYKNHVYVGLNCKQNKLFVLRTANYFMPSGIMRALYDGAIGEEHSLDIRSYAAIHITDYTSKQLVRFIENREVERINTRRRDIKATWRTEALNAIANTGDKHMPHSDNIK